MSNDQFTDPVNVSAKGPTKHLEHYRREARALLRAVRSAEPEHVTAAAIRFLKLRSFTELTIEAIRAEPRRIRLKHALAVVAQDAGYDSWSTLLAAGRQDSTELADTLDAMYSPAMAAMMNRWFADYNEAARSLKEAGGYLLPYGRQFFVTERGGIEALGLDPDDADWQKIGHNWLQPADRSAWSRIWDKRLVVLAANGRDVS